MSDYTELKSLFKRWGLPVAEYSEGGEKTVEPLDLGGSALSTTEFIFNQDESFKTLKIDNL